MSLQTAYNDGASINEAALDTTINITQSDTGASNYLLKVANSGSGRGLQVDNNGASYALVLRQFGAGNCVAIGQKSTSTHNVLELENSGSGKTVLITHTGTGTVIDIASSTTGSDLKISHNNTSSASAAISIINAGSGHDIAGNYWNVSYAGYATFQDVSVCAGIGRVHAYNTAYAGGRVHVYSRSQTVNKDLHCSWGMSRTPIDYGQENPFGLHSMIDLYFAYDVYCPIVHVQPWFPAYYDEEAEDAPDWEFGVPSGQGNKTLEPSILGYIPGESGPGCIAGVHLAFSQCVWGIPTSSYQSEFGPGEYDYPEDLVFDFQVLGCECPA